MNLDLGHSFSRFANMNDQIMEIWSSVALLSLQGGNKHREEAEKEVNLKEGRGGGLCWSPEGS